MRVICLLLLTLSWCTTHAQWDSLYSFFNPTYALHAHNNSIYLGLGGGGVYKSEDSGVTWEPKNNGIQFGGAYIYSLASSSDTLYAGGFGEVCRSADGGENWTLLNLNLDLNASVTGLEARNNFIFAGISDYPASNGVYKKLLNGVVWNNSSEGLPPGEGVNTLKSHGDYLFAGTDGGLFRSSDLGTTWTDSGSGIEPGLDINEITSLNGRLFAGTDNGVYISTDNGTTWFHSIGLSENTIIVSFAGNEDFVVAGSYQTAYFSEDQGYSWSILNFGLPAIISMYSMCADENYVYAGSGGVVWRYSFLSLSSEEQITPSPNQLTTYPNPASEYITCALSDELHHARLTLFGSDGRIVLEKEQLTGSRIELDVSHLAGGFYLLVINDGVTSLKKPIFIAEE